MQETPRANRLHMVLFGRRNVGKSSLINALTGQNIAIVSPVAGTTTDPVQKAMEILPIGPVMIIDTAGLDDVGELGALRVKKSLEMIKRTDLILLVLDDALQIGAAEQIVLVEAKKRQIPVVAVANKNDTNQFKHEVLIQCQAKLGAAVIATSALTGEGIDDLKMAIIKNAPTEFADAQIVGDLLNAGDTVVLVVPIDTAAPKGRLILPQVQVIRDLLDSNCATIVVKENQLKQTLDSLKQPPAMVITDSQVFGAVSKIVPKNIVLTSFSILFARYKGDLPMLVAGAKAIDSLKPGDKVLIAEACTHHRQEDDIGTVKIPGWLNAHVGGELDYTWSAGIVFDKQLADYKLIVHCGSCMITRREMLERLFEAKAEHVPVVNYGIAIAHMHGILPRVLSPFPECLKILGQEV